MFIALARVIFCVSVALPIVRLAGDEARVKFVVVNADEKLDALDSMLTLPEVLTVVAPIKLIASPMRDTLLELEETTDPAPMVD